MSDDTIIRDETGPQRLIGYVLNVGRTDGCAECWLDLNETHLNRHGVLHGGIVSALLDSACGATGSLTIDRTGRVPFLTISLTTQFLAPAGKGRVTAVGRVVGGGKNLLFIEGTLSDEEGRLIASANGVFKRVPNERSGTDRAS